MQPGRLKISYTPRFLPKFKETTGVDTAFLPMYSPLLWGLGYMGAQTKGEGFGWLGGWRRACPEEAQEWWEWGLCFRSSVLAPCRGLTFLVTIFDGSKKMSHTEDTGRGSLALLPPLRQASRGHMNMGRHADLQRV